MDQSSETLDRGNSGDETDCGILGRVIPVGDGDEVDSAMTSAEESCYDDSSFEDEDSLRDDMTISEASECVVGSEYDSLYGLGEHGMHLFRGTSEARSAISKSIAQCWNDHRRNEALERIRADAPEAFREPDALGILPLHEALLCGAPLSTVELVMGAFPEALLCDDHCGRTLLSHFVSPIFRLRHGWRRTVVACARALWTTTGCRKEFVGVLEHCLADPTLAAALLRSDVLARRDADGWLPLQAAALAGARTGVVYWLLRESPSVLLEAATAKPPRDGSQSLEQTV